MNFDDDLETEDAAQMTLAVLLEAHPDRKEHSFLGTR